jgi:meso-butanediol dehydrogenase/(S,S)-butanediol dehydrogenase/diacetyl reductase
MEVWKMGKRLDGKVAVVTGGGGGLGEGICLCLAREGAQVVVSDINLSLAEKVSAKVKEVGQKSLAIQTDVRLAGECQNLVDTSLKEMGRIDILVCNAGVLGINSLMDSTEPPWLENISEEDWDQTLDVNLKGVFLCNRAIAPYFKRQKKGKIINIASIGGRRGLPYIPHYCASKAGVIVLTQGVAAQLAPFNVNVNTICPGVIWTPMWEKLASMLSKSYPPFKGMSPGEVFRGRVQNAIPQGKSQTPEGIGNAVVFLASEEANEITAQAMNVDGGAVFS